MRNIFDQYTSPENRMSHALACCLQRDRTLLREFVQWVTGRRGLPWRELEIAEQQVPGEPIERSPGEEAGLPDIWIHAGSWALLIESKVMAGISADQLRRHRRTAERNEFTDIDVLLLSPKPPRVLDGDVKHRSWTDIYRWLRSRQDRSSWAACMVEYMEVAETRMVADGYLGDPIMTEFSGIPFGNDHPYSYNEAKRVLRGAMAELRKRTDLQRKLRIDPSSIARPKLMGAWDLLTLGDAGGVPFVHYPHFTLAVVLERILVLVILPNGVQASLRKNLSSLDNDAFVGLVSRVNDGVLKGIRAIESAYPYMEMVQRRYASRSAWPTCHAKIEFDLRTAVGGAKSVVKKQPQWLDAVHDALRERNSNLQLAIGAALPYGDERLRSREILDVIASVWIGCKPWLDKILNH